MDMCRVGVGWRPDEGKERSIPSKPRPCATANLSQEQPLAPNADLLIAVRQPAVLRPGSSGMLYILLLHP